MSNLAVDVVKADGPYDDQRPGTSGLRKRVATFQKGTYLQNFVQAILDAVEETTSGLDKSKPILLSGDGRYFNKQVSGRPFHVRCFIDPGICHARPAKLFSRCWRRTATST